MRAYSQDLREKVIVAVAQDKQSNRAIAETLSLSEPTIERWTRRQRETGSVVASAHAGGVARGLAPHETFLRDAVKAQPDISLDELCGRVKTELGLTVSGSMVSRELTRLRLSRKKKSLHDTERETERVKAMRATFAQHMLDDLAPLAEKLHFIDEIGTHLGLTRLYGRAAPGERVVEATPGFSGPHYTSVAALNLRGVHAPFVFQGNMDGPAFETYVEHILGPDLVKVDIVIMDNLYPTQHPVIRSLIEARGATVEFLPPYSPDLNPIENCWSKAKAFLL